MVARITRRIALASRTIARSRSGHRAAALIAALVAGVQLATLVAAGPARAQVAVGVEGGLTVAPTEARKGMKDGPEFGLRLSRPIGRWMDAHVHLGFGRHAAFSSSDLAVMERDPFGNLYLPASEPKGHLLAWSMVGGVSRSFGSGWVRPFVEGQAGVMVIDEPGEATFANDRRPVPQRPAMAANAIIFESLRPTAPTHAGPAFGIATGVRMRASFATVDLSGGILWEPIRGALAPLVPLKIGATWPASSAMSDRDGAPAPVSIRPFAGVTHAFQKANAEHGTSGFSWGVGATHWLTSMLAIELEGEQSRHHRTITLVFGDTLAFPPFGYDQSYTTVLTGMRVSSPTRRARAYARLLAGWGRLASSNSFEADRDAVAWSGGAGFEVDLPARLGAFGEADVKRLELDPHPAELGIVHFGVRMR